MSDPASQPSQPRPSHGQIVESAFRPAWWLRNPHLQTLWPKLRSAFGGRKTAQTHQDIRLERRRFELDDGDFIDVSMATAARGPRVLIVHGLEGGLDSHYAGSLVNRLAHAGFQPLFMHLRGTGGEPNRLARSYHSGATEDLEAVLSHLADADGVPVDAAIGFSLGGNLLLKYLGEQGLGEPSAPRIGTAVAVSVPFVLRDAMLRLDLGVSRLYRGYLVKRLKASYRAKFANRSSPLQVDLDQIQDFNTFDDQITAPLNGFEGVFDYYERASCRRYLQHIQTPTLIIHAADDPFMFPSTVPFAHELGPGITLELARRGGHVGFVSSATPWSSGSWLETRILAALSLAPGAALDAALDAALNTGGDVSRAVPTSARVDARRSDPAPPRSARHR